MSKNDKLEKAYRDLQRKESPDLWNKIESSISPRESSEEKCLAVIHEEVSQGKQKYYRFGAGMAAAACIAVIVLGAQNGIGQKSAPMEITAAGVAQTEAVNGSAETVAAETAAVETAAAETAAVETVAAETTAAETTQRILLYDSLSLMGNVVPVPSEEAILVSEHQYYFTEDILKDTGLLTEVSVSSVSYEKDNLGRISQVVYEVLVDKVLYSEDYVKEDQRLLVRSPLVGDGREILYELKEGGRYVLPLKPSEGGYDLVYPYAPQIEVTADNSYVFHNGWRSLVHEETSVVVMNSSAEGDYYYDRMVFRDDDQFLSNLTQLAEAKRGDGEGEL